jgi:hypothetical protein
MQFNPVAPEAIDSSMLQTFVDCPRRFYLEYVLGLRQKEKNTALSYGTIWHGALEILYGEGDMEAALTYIEENEHEFPFQDPKNRTMERMRSDLLLYAAHWSAVDASQEVLALEKAFDLELPSGLRYCGRLDQLRKAPSGLIVLDHKTSTFVDHSYFKRHEMGYQLKGYVWAMNQLVPGANVEMAMIDLCHILKNDTKWQRKTFNFHPTIINDWLNSVSILTDQIAEMCVKYLDDPEPWYMNFRSCGDWGGCVFKDVHSMADVGNTRENVLETFFHEERWDPTK